MRTIKLPAKFDFDFQLFGIISKAKEYKLSWAINNSTDLELKKEDDIHVGLKNDQELRVSNFKCKTETCSFYLIKNKLEEEIEGEQIIFAPSLKSFDFLLKVESDKGTGFVNNLYNGIRSIDCVDSVLKLDVDKIKEKEYFLL